MDRSLGRSLDTAFVCDERYFWHSTGSGTLDLPVGGFVEPGVFAENPETKRRARNLIEVSGLLDALTTLRPRQATIEELLRFHSSEYVEKIRRLSNTTGGDAGDGGTPFGRGSFEIACLAAGGCLTATEGVVRGAIRNAYVLCRPPGHHAQPDSGAGFCIFNNVVLSALHARSLGIRKILILDWDAHHGHGIQYAFWDEPEVVYVSIHQDRYYPTNTGLPEESGGPKARGATVNIPLPAGSGDGALEMAVQSIVVPIISTFGPELVLVASGLDMNFYDPFSQLAVTSEGFRSVTQSVISVVEKVSEGRIVFCHEGGYSEGYVPFCLLAILETLAGRRTVVEDPFLPAIRENPALQISRSQIEAVTRCLHIQREFWPV